MKYTYQQLIAKDSGELIAALEWIIPDAAFELTNEDEIASDMASTNALGWGVDTVEIRKDSIQKKKEGIECVVDVQLCGEQEEDRPFGGDTICVTATALITPEGKVLWDEIESELQE